MQIQFQKYMYDKGVSFMVSDRIYREVMHAILEKKRLNFKNFFSLTYKSITKYFKNKKAYGYSINNRKDVFALIWGSSFFYDFLFKNHLISEKTYKTFIEEARKVKGEIIGGFIDNLWQFSFVHQWGKPNCITEQEFENEVKIFQKSYNYVPSDDIKTEDVFSEELENIGDLKKSILKGIKNKKTFIPNTTLLDSFFDDNFNEIFNDNFFSEKLSPPLDRIKSDRITVSDTPIRVNKIGRNEPCPCGSGKKYKKCCGGNK